MHNHNARTRAVLCAAFAALFAGCLDGTGPEGLGPGLHVIEGPVADSAFATVPDLVVEVRGQDGSPVKGAAVEFRSPAEGGQPFVYLHRQGKFASLQSVDTTDARGRASTPVTLGNVAGTARMLVTVQAAGYQDTVPFTVQPGALDSIVILPADTAVYAGASFQLRATGVDRWGNPRTDGAVNLTPSAATQNVISVQGTTVRGTIVGRGVITGTFGGVTAFAYVSVVPQGTLVARSLRPTSLPPREDFVVMNLDGSGAKNIFLDGAPENLGGNNIEMGPEWTPSGTEIAFHDGYPRLKLWAVDLEGHVRSLFPTGPTTMETGGPRYSRDGAWVYFNAGDGSRYVNQVWRVRADGTAPERLTPDTPAFYAHDIDPSPSPDGTKIVYGTDRERGSGISPPYRLVVMDLATRQVRGLGVIGSAPRWSPAGDLIAYERDRRLWVVRADGTGERAITPPNSYYEKGVSWSPDGQWIAATGFGPFIHLVHVESGLVLPLAFTGYLRDPAWRP
jgi:Tol biopolymer transport system component